MLCLPTSLPSILIKCCSWTTEGAPFVDLKPEFQTFAKVTAFNNIKHMLSPNIAKYSEDKFKKECIERINFKHKLMYAAANSNRSRHIY